MSVNHSSFTNDYLLPPSSYYNFSFLPLDCIVSGNLYTAFAFTNNIFLLPLSILVLTVGFQRWRQQRSISSPVVTSFSDFFTYNIAVMELIGVVGYTIQICSRYIYFGWMMIGPIFTIFPWNGQMSFPIMTCVERYVAVVYPITYRQLKQKRGVCIRNISTAVVWLQCFGGLSFCLWLFNRSSITYLPSVCILLSYLIALSVCSLSVLRVLIRPRPGEAGRNGVQVHESKLRAFKTIMIIMGVLWLRFGGTLVCNVTLMSPTVSASVRCLLTTCELWLCLPSSLVLPLLFLYRAEKLPGCKHNTESE